MGTVALAVSHVLNEPLLHRHFFPLDVMDTICFSSSVVVHFYGRSLRLIPRYVFQE